MIEQRWKVIYYIRRTGTITVLEFRTEEAARAVMSNVYIDDAIVVIVRD